MRQLKALGRRFWIKSDKGAPLVEYTVLLGLLGVSLLAIIITLGLQVDKTFDTVASSIEDPNGPGTDPEIVGDPTGPTGPTGPSCDPSQFNVAECTPFHEAILECDVESLEIGEACPGTNLVYAGPIDDDRFYTYNPNLPGLTPPNYEGDPEYAWDSIDSDSDNFYAFGYGGDARNAIDIMMHSRPHPAGDYCTRMGSYLPSPEQMDMMELHAAELGFPQNPSRIYQTSSQYWPGFGGFGPAPIGEPLNYAFLNTMGGSVGASQHGFVTHEFFVRCITDLRNILDDEDLWLDGTPNDDNSLQLSGQLGARGFDGNDRLFGTLRMEIFIGGPGNDLMMGGYGDDTYVFEGDFGTDTIDDSGAGNDTIEFRGLNLSDFTIRPVSGSTRDLRFTHANGSSVTVIGMRYVSNSELIENLVFADTGQLSGVSMRAAVLENQEETGTVLGFYQNDRYEYTLGETGFTVTEEGGSDIFSFPDTSVNDWRFINTGRNLLMRHVDSGEEVTIIDQFYVSNSRYIESFVFSDATLTQSGAVNKASADSILAGGTITGSYGDDVYPIPASLPTAVTIVEEGGNDRMEFFDSASTDWTFRNTGRDLRITNDISGVTVTIDDQFYVSNSSYVETFQFTDVTLDRQGAINKAAADSIEVGGNITGSYGNDVYPIPASLSTAVTIFEEGGTDRVEFFDSASTDWRFFNTGRDLRMTNTTSGVTVTVDDQFYVSNSSYVETFQFTDGTLSRQGAIDKASADTIQSGGSITGSYGNDTYRIPAALASALTIFEEGGTDRIEFFDSASTDWTFRNTGRDLRITNDTTGVTITVDDQFYVSSSSYIESFQFTDVTLDRQGAINKAASDSIPNGGTIYGSYSNDLFPVLANTSGFTLYEEGGSDTIQFTDSASTDWTFGVTARNLIVTNDVTGNSFTINDQFYVSSSDYVENMIFTDRSMDRLGMVAKAYEDVSAAGGYFYAPYNTNFTYNVTAASFVPHTIREQGGTDRIVFDGPSTDWAFVNLGRDMRMTHIATNKSIVLVDHLYVSSSQYVEAFEFTDVTLDRAGSVAKANP